MASPKIVENGTDKKFCRGGYDLLQYDGPQKNQESYLCREKRKVWPYDFIAYRVIAFNSLKTDLPSNADRQNIEMARHVSIDATETSAANVVIFMIGAEASEVAAISAFEALGLKQSSISVQSTKTSLLQLVAGSKSVRSEDYAVSEAHVVAGKGGPILIWLQTVPNGFTPDEFRLTIENAWMNALGLARPTSRAFPLHSHA